MTDQNSTNHVNLYVANRMRTETIKEQAYEEFLKLTAKADAASRAVTATTANFRAVAALASATQSEKVAAYQEDLGAHREYMALSFAAVEAGMRFNSLYNSGVVQEKKPLLPQTWRVIDGGLAR